MTVTLTDEEEHSFLLAGKLEAGAYEAAVDAGLDPISVAYDLWLFLTRTLVDAGWTPEELMRDCGHHAADQASEGRA